MSKPYGKLILVLPGNSLHSNVLKEGWNMMYEEKAGLDVIGNSGIPVTVSYQGMDYQILPWLKETLGKHSCIDVMNAPHSHSLIPLCGEKMIQWETKNVIGNIPVTFFPEFYAPKAHFIPTKFFIFIEGMTYSYSHFATTDDVESETLPNAPSIKIGDKIGVMMKEKLFKGFLSAWFRFQRDPVSIDQSSNNKQPLEHLLDQVEKIGESGEVVVCPLDIETVYIGSCLGKKAYELFFQGVKNRGLESVFARLSDNLDYFKAKAEPSKHPHRILTKWMTYEVQAKYLISLAKITPKNEKEAILLSIASCSDIYSAWERKVGEAQKKIMLSGRDLAGNEKRLPISYNQDIIDVQHAAKQALQEKTSYEKILQELPDQSPFIKRMVECARKYKL